MKHPLDDDESFSMNKIDVILEENEKIAT